MEPQQSIEEKDYFVLYLVIATLVLIAIIAAVKLLGHH